MGWKIDYQKLLNYLRDKYKISRAFYFGGVETHNFLYDYLQNDTAPIEELEKYLAALIRERGEKFDEAYLMLISRHL